MIIWQSSGLEQLTMQRSRTQPGPSLALTWMVTRYLYMPLLRKCHLVEIGSQLEQGEIPMHYYEYVYWIVKDIQLMRPQEFKNVVPVLGSFHWSSQCLNVLGNILTGIRASYVWLEASSFCPTIIQISVLNGGHHACSLQGMKLLTECFEHLTLKEFFTKKDARPYRHKLDILIKWKHSVVGKKVSDSQEDMSEFSKSRTKLTTDISTFKQEQSRKMKTSNA